MPRIPRCAELVVFLLLVRSLDVVAQTDVNSPKPAARSQPVPAHAIVEAVAAASPGDLLRYDNIDVRGRLFATGVADTVACSLSFRGVRFLDAVSFDDVAFADHVEFIDCEFRRGASFLDTHFLASVRFYGCAFGEQTTFKRALVLK